MTGVVYVHTNKVNGKVYVGQTWQNPEKRFRSGRGYSRTKHARFSNAIHKYGWDGFDHQVLTTASTQEELDNLEKVWIIALQATDREHGYNSTSGGHRGKHSMETRQRLSEAAKRRFENPEERQKLRKPKSEEARRKYSDVAKKRTGARNPFFGRHHKPETNELNRVTHLGKPAPWTLDPIQRNEVGEKIRIFRTGKKFPRLLGVG